MASGKYNIASIAMALAISLAMSLPSQGDESKEFQGWVKTYCHEKQASEPTVLDAGACSSDDENYKNARSGVRYKVLREGSGRASRRGDVVIVDYVGWLFDEEAAYARGAVIDSSYADVGNSFEFKLGRKSVIEGWEYGIRGMKPGEIRELIVDANMAYGNKGIPDRVPPKSKLVFEIELRDFGSKN